MPGQVKYEVYDGDKFGELVVQEIGKGPRGILCRCSCGREVATNRRSLALGLAKRCIACRNVKLADKWRMPDGHAARTEIYNDYVHSAKKRGITWGLTKDEFYPLIDRNCHYCDSPPSTEKKTSRIKYGTYTYNGVDRLYPDQGYVQENVVSCCSVCSYAKGRLTERQFLDMVERIYHTQTAR